MIKFTYGSQEWPYLTVTPRQSRDYYESAKYVVYRMRFEGGNNPVLINCYGDALSDAEGWKINIDPVEGEWTEYFFDARVLLEFFDNYSENRLVWYATQGTPGTVYIDDVYCVWEAADIEISTQNCKLADVPEEGILLEASSEAYTGEYEYIVKELDAFGNETGDNLASGNRFMPEKTANYLIIARPSDPSYTGEARKTIVVNADKFISLSGDILPVDPIAGDEISIPTGQVSDGIEILPQQVSLSALYKGVPVEIKNGCVYSFCLGDFVADVFLGRMRPRYPGSGSQEKSRIESRRGRVVRRSRSARGEYCHQRRCRVAGRIRRGKRRFETHFQG